MAQTIEIEFKNLLTKSEYEMLLKKFNLTKSQVITQENHYFDTVEFSLKEKRSALRIREKKNHFEMTLKQPANIGLLETTQILSKDEATKAIQFGMLPSGIIQDLIVELKIPFERLEYFGSLLTKRIEFSYKNGLLVLDHSSYLNKDDYELEYEVENYQTGQQIFRDLLKQFSIPERKTENKIQRFYHQKYSKNNSN
jgi:uncharacterized protein YjbK